MNTFWSAALHLLCNYTLPSSVKPPILTPKYSTRGWYWVVWHQIFLSQIPAMLPIFRLKILAAKRETHITDGTVVSVQREQLWEYELKERCGSITIYLVSIYRQLHHTLALHNDLYISHNTPYQQSLVYTPRIITVWLMSANLWSVGQMLWDLFLVKLRSKQMHCKQHHRVLGKYQ